MTSFALRARYVFPVADEPVADGVVGVADGRIVAADAIDEVRDLGNVAILPGLVNAHAHLDASDLSAPLGERGIPLVDWIRRLMEHRRLVGSGSPAVSRGLAESLRAGVTLVGDIAQPDWPRDEAARSPLGIVAFQELIAPTANRVAAAVDLAKRHVERALPTKLPGILVPRPCSVDTAGATAGLSSSAENTGGQATRGTRQFRLVGPLASGLSPHAPYSVHPSLLSAVVKLSREKRLPVAMHLAESREELELLRHGGGPFRAFLRELGADDAATMWLGARPLDFLRQLAEADHAAIVHGNYLNDDEIAFLASNRRRMAVVYCPRTHDWFAHDPYPLARWLAAGATVALGTDGRGSSPDLSLFDEMRFAARRHPGVRPSDLVRMATLGGAAALGLDAACGSIAPGKRADLTIVALPKRDGDPHELLFDRSSRIAACYVGGIGTCRSGNTALS